MARRGGRRGRRGTKIPIISVAVLVGQVALARFVAGSDPLAIVNHFQSQYTGYDFLMAQFRPERLVAGYVPWLAKRFIGAVARPRMPIKGLPISLS